MATGQMRTACSGLAGGGLGIHEGYPDDGEDETMAIDPVCGMQVDPAKAAGTSEYQGQTYVFCSAGCKRKFDSNPKQYTSK